MTYNVFSGTLNPTHQSFRRLQNSLSKTRLIRNSYFSYRRYAVQLCIAETEYELSKKRMHRIQNLSLNLNKPMTTYACAMF